MTDRKPLVYIAGPMTVGHPTRLHNLADAYEVFDYLMKHGIMAVVPQAIILVADALSHIDYEKWLAYDFELIRRCDALVRIPGQSKGADREVEFANAIGVRVFFGDTGIAAADAAITAYRSTIRFIRTI